MILLKDNYKNIINQLTDKQIVQQLFVSQYLILIIAIVLGWLLFDSWSEFTNLFIKEIGYFSISFIELFSRLEKKIPQYLNDFKEPFDSLFFLQSISDKMPFAGNQTASSS